MENPFAGMQIYVTPHGTPPLFPGLVFYPWFMGLIYRYRRDALRGEVSGEYFPARSLEVIRRIERSGGRFRITGLHHLAGAPGPAVFVSNHMSTLETVTLPGIIHLFHPVTFVVKESLVSGPVFGPVMRSRQPVVVSRRYPRRDLITVLREGKKRLESGISVILFPQGTRSRSFHPGQFNTLGVKLARHAGARLIPLALKTDFWSNGLLVRPMGRLRPVRTIHMAFGSALDPGMAPDELHDRTIRHIRDHLRDWGMSPSSLD